MTKRRFLIFATTLAAITAAAAIPVGAQAQPALRETCPMKAGSAVTAAPDPNSKILAWIDTGERFEFDERGGGYTYGTAVLRGPQYVYGYVPTGDIANDGESVGAETCLAMS
ncbi:hypothetical protein [Fodinicola feengrottensis]